MKAHAWLWICFVVPGADNNQILNVNKEHPNEMKLIKQLFTLLIITQLVSCESGPGGGGELSDPEPVLKVLSPSQITESSFQINWSIENPVGFQSIGVQVATNEDMSNSVTYVQIDDIATDHLLVDNLAGASLYYYKVSLSDNGSATVESEIKSIETAYKTESINLVTEDDYTLKGKLAYLESLSGPRPGIIMMHEFGVWVNPWIGSPLLRQMVSEGYMVLSFFFRGHGTSTPVDDLMELINDKSLLTKDLQSAIDFMKSHELSTGELGLIGGSMGAIMALAGNGYEEVLTSVALSPTQDGVFLIFPDMKLTSVYYLVGELDIHDDPAVDFPLETQSLYEITSEPRKLNLIPGTSDHGSNLLTRDSLNASIKNWFLEQLPHQ
jgi:hypothetical protein